MQEAGRHLTRQPGAARAAVLVTLFCLSAAAGAWAQAVYRNPVIAGDYPDPTVIRAGEEYWAAVTTGSWAPHFTLLRSRDLVNWQIAGAVFTRRPAWARGDFWAPELIEHAGRFHLYYTARRDEGPKKAGTLCVAVATAAAPGGPYTDHGPLVCQIPELKNVGSIDAFLLRDERGDPYLVWKADGNDAEPDQPTSVFAQRLSADGLKLQGKRREILRNTEAWERHVTEGSYITRRGEWFYHFYSGNACCGRGCDYALGVARSRTLFGRWEKHPRNPILKANADWQCPGHGTAVEAPGGRLFLLYHSYRNRPWTFSVGREALLDEVVWGEDGWPSINGGAGPSSAARAPLGVAEADDGAEYFDDFATANLGPEWQWPMSSEPNARLLPDSGRLLLAPASAAGGAAPATTRGGAAAAGDEWAAAVLALRTSSADYVATAAVGVPPADTKTRAGLSAYSWRNGAVGVSIGGGRVFVWRRENQTRQTLADVPAPAGATIQLRMTAEGGENYRFAVSPDGREWQALGGPVAGGHVEGARVALTVGGPPGPAASFDWLRITPRR
jgi:xylan 1,4-beta-xylosidase